MSESTGYQWCEAGKYQHTTDLTLCIDCGREAFRIWGCWVQKVWNRLEHTTRSFAGLAVKAAIDENKIDKIKDTSMGCAAPDPFKACYACEKGKYQKKLLQDFIFVKTQGMYSQNRNKSCSECPKGTYQNYLCNIIQVQKLPTRSCSTWPSECVSWLQEGHFQESDIAEDYLAGLWSRKSVIWRRSCVMFALQYQLNSAKLLFQLSSRF